MIFNGTPALSRQYRPEYSNKTSFSAYVFYMYLFPLLPILV
jgi:hypothetical protein